MKDNQSDQSDQCPKILTNPTIISQMMWRGLGQTSRKSLEQDVLELGCYQGFLSVFLRHALNFYEYPAHYHVVDTFKGFPYPGSSREIYKEGDLNPGNKDLPELLSKQGINVLRGKAESFQDVYENMDLAFAFFDLDIGEPTRLCWPSISESILEGGIVGFHDYCETPGYGLPEIAEIVNDILENDERFKEVYRTKKGRDNRFIFLERVD